MDSLTTNPRIELRAVRMGIEWKGMFDDELQRAARQLAGNAKCVTCEHYRDALPIAVGRFLQAAERSLPESEAHATRRIA